MTKATQKLLAFGFGAVFVIVLLVIAINFPNPTTFQYIVFRIVLALVAAGVAVMIPGFLELNIAKWLRAGGALAIFVIVYFYNPAFFAVQNAAREVSRRNAKDEFALLLERRLLAVGSQYKSGAYELDAPMEVTGVERSEIYRVHSKYVSLTSDLHNSLINGRYMQTYSVLVELKSLLNQIQSWGPSYQSLEEELFRQISPELRPNIAKNLPELQPSLTLFDQEHSNFAR